MRNAPDLSALRAAVIEAANRVDIRNRETREANLAAYRAAAAKLHAAESDWSHRAPLERWHEDYTADFEEATQMNTTATITLEHLGATATPTDLASFAELLREVCNGDDRVTMYDITERHESITIEIDGEVTAEQLSNEVFEGNWGAW